MEEDLPEIEQLKRLEDPEQAFDELPPKWIGVVDVIKKRRAVSAPGPNEVPYKIIREEKDSKGELAIVWLDLANAYGTLPHKLVELLLEIYHVPDGIRELIKEYFNHLQLRFTVGDYTTSWQRLKVERVTGCMISAILFSAVMNMTCEVSREEEQRAMDEVRSTVTTMKVIHG
ncbi:Hypothetical predicted protein [Mytilus galloprovincialis]|uniref:Reverse transcriptase domain-containing protein n=1 Tax=Mytilus galloprovincialis TaxID=29158 RepID=A0A8B6E6U0_MYTGA|nr:Hypothetical predicted protein [Mytilus galloprovincialis]